MFIRFSYNETIICLSTYINYLIGMKSGLTIWNNMISMSLIDLVQSGLYNDTRLQYKDGEMFAPRVIVALCRPELYCILRDTEEDQVTILMPEHEMIEIDQQLLSFMSGEMKVI